MKTNKWHRMEVIFELLVFGLIIGIAEDLLAIKLATNETITPRVIGIVVLVAIPFAIIGEIIFDRIDFAKIFQRMFEKKKQG
ncbi:MAG: hypothetical protein ABH831_01950 [Candidatus Nealsonbacteria bacterium]